MSTRKGEKENWNSESALSKIENRIQRTRTIRKLKDIGQALGLMTTRSDPTDPPNKTENEQKLNGLLEDIRYAFVDYQVRTRKSLALNVSDVCLRLHCNEKFVIKTVSRL